MAKGRSKFDKLRAKIEKDMKGAVRIQDVEDVTAPFHLRRPSGVLNLDIGTDGGMPGGSIVQLHGRDGVSKTGLSFHYCAENQRVYGAESAIFVASFGYKPDLNYMRMCGMRLALSDQEVLEAGYTLEDVPAAVRGETIGEVFFLDLGLVNIAAEAPAETIFAAAASLVESGMFQLGVVDEFGSGETKDVVVKGLEETVKVAAWASLVTRFCQRMYTILRIPLEDGSPNATTLFVLNPARAAGVGGSGGRVKPGYVPPDNMTSGFALKHAKAVDILLKSGAQVKQGKNRVGKQVHWRIIKGKHGLHEGLSGTYVWLDGEGIDMVTELANAAKTFDTIHRAGRWWRILDYEDKIEGGLEGVIDLLREEPELYQELYEKTIAEAQDSLILDDDDSIHEDK